MLFRPVYGPELEAIYSFISQSEIRTSRQDIHQVFLPSRSNQNTLSTQNIDDALSFLISAGLITEFQNQFETKISINYPFRLLVINHLRQLSQNEIEPKHPTDPLYFRLLDELFIKPDRLYVVDVHAEANKMHSVSEIGGISKEKIQSWKRVMEFLGTGRRLSAGFQLVYSKDLILEILDSWNKEEATLQSFFEHHFSLFLPFRTNRGDLPRSLESIFLFLEKTNVLRMNSRHDIPSRAYFGELKYKCISYLEGKS
jgi:hypothetical protein